MSEAKFTKGPWISMVRNDDDAMMSFYGVGIGKAFVSVSTCGNNSVHDAHLIAAAPEMYAFINKLTIGLANDFPSLRDSAIEILAKARGE